MGASLMSALVVIAVIAAVGYFVSLRIHPLTRCRTCRMTGRHFGGVYKNSFRRCRTCGGTGRQDRLGTKIFFGGTNNTGFYPKKLPALP
jgi:DnaJ-class molecular chaperone